MVVLELCTKNFVFFYNLDQSINNFFLLGESATRGSRTRVTWGQYPSATTITLGAPHSPQAWSTSKLR